MQPLHQPDPSGLQNKNCCLPCNKRVPLVAALACSNAFQKSSMASAWLPDERRSGGQTKKIRRVMTLDVPNDPRRCCRSKQRNFQRPMQFSGVLEADVLLNLSCSPLHESTAIGCKTWRATVRQNLIGQDEGGWLPVPLFIFRIATTHRYDGLVVVVVRLEKE